MTTPKEFYNELSRLYAAARAKGLMSDDLAIAAKTDWKTVALWIGGYACPDTSEEREAVLLAVAALDLT